MSFAERAQSLIGTRFRPQGRDRAGVDCAGLAILAFALPPEQFRSDYRLRGQHRASLASALSTDFRQIAPRACRPGDLMLLQAAVDQLHLAVKSPAGFIHADAKIGRVVETPGDPEAPVLAVYRRRARPVLGR